MITIDALRSADARAVAVQFAYAASAMVRTARFALANDSGGSGSEHKDADAALTLEVADALLCVVLDGCELMERDLAKDKGRVAA